MHYAYYSAVDGIPFETDAVIGSLLCPGSLCTVTHAASHLL